eukprot:CAMPEP_0202479302 /NCGR_PEP_ID=MMETSP1360-20130828/94911_1 /ASSEMBLY_ACC=CAM_ASM_000848 /TAXON_ID=515479 /ORGANISM="Licmophora paradoxa, Strain CCMP2313" /LENGTH=86 /DNA_ID=CAMNT_0049106621 /DNA_START=582 /DNA_END=841 /DNA_ORIENTATION=+
MAYKQHRWLRNKSSSIAFFWACLMYWDTEGVDDEEDDSCEDPEEGSGITDFFLLLLFDLVDDLVDADDDDGVDDGVVPLAVVDVVF